MAELADAHGSGPCESNFMEVRVLLPAPSLLKEDTMADVNNTVTINSDITETIIGKKTTFKGSVNTDRPFTIEGNFEGDVVSTTNVIVAETGVFKGTMKCHTLDLKGDVNATVICEDVMRFAESGKFRGDAEVANIDIHPGCDFQGNLKIVKKAL